MGGLSVLFFCLRGGARAIKDTEQQTLKKDNVSAGHGKPEDAQFGISCSRDALPVPPGPPAPSDALIYPNTLACQAGRAAANDESYDIMDVRNTMMFSAPSFILSSISEGYNEEYDGRKYGINGYLNGGVADPHAATHGSAPTAAATLSYSSPAAGGGAAVHVFGGCSSSDPSYEHEYEYESSDSGRCDFAIMPPAPLSTVYEEESVGEGFRGVAAAGCHSAEAGVCSIDRLPGSEQGNLIRGLSAPSCTDS